MADTLTKETGAIVSGADSYNTLAELETHFTNYGSPTGWSSLTDVQKCAYARVATRWMDPRWEWVGVIVDTTTPQALAWPRQYATDADGREWDEDEIPPAIQRLHAEVTRMSAEGKLQVSEVARGGLVASQAAGPVPQSFFAHSSGFSSYPFLDGIAKPLTVDGAMGLRFASNGG